MAGTSYELCMYCIMIIPEQGLTYPDQATPWLVVDSA